MRKELGKWLMDAALFVTTVLVFQVLQEAVASLAVAVLLGVATAAVCLAAGLALVDDKDTDKDTKKKNANGTKGRSNAVRAGARKARKRRGRRAARRR